MCASAYRGRDFTIVLVFPLPLFKTYFFIYYSRDDLLLEEDPGIISFRNATRYKAAPTAEEDKSCITETNEKNFFFVMRDKGKILNINSDKKKFKIFRIRRLLVRFVLNICANFH